MAAAHLTDFQNIFSLKTKVAVVTGGSKGLGLAAASGMLQHGLAKVYITARTASTCDEAAAALNKLPNKAPGAQAVSVPGDSSTVEGIQKIVNEISKTTTHVDILLVNAGMVHRERFDTHNEEAWDQVMNINLKGAFYAVQRFLPLLTNRATVQETSRVIVTASVSGMAQTTLGEAATHSYAAAKAGTIHMCKQLAVDLGPRHVLTNSISPGFFPTELAGPLIEKLGGEAAMAKTYPNGKLGSNEDFAGTVVWLGSRAGSHCNGINVVIDGGGIIGRIGS